MNCTVVYGLSRSIKHRIEMPVEEAFRKLNDHWFVGWAFVNIYYNNRLVYTDQGAAGYRYICDDCPYGKREGRCQTLSPQQAV